MIGGIRAALSIRDLRKKILLTLFILAVYRLAANIPVPGCSTNIAPLGAVTASSEALADGQQAVKAVDEVIDGWPGDFTREWATLSEGAGAVLRKM